MMDKEDSAKHKDAWEGQKPAKRGGEDSEKGWRPSSERPPVTQDDMGTVYEGG